VTVPLSISRELAFPQWKATDPDRPRIGLLTNPRSGGNRENRGKVEQVLARYPGTFELEASTPDQIADALVEFASREVALLAINGGDGTVQAVLTNLFRYSDPLNRPLLALLESGTSSMLARDAGLPGSADKALERLLHWAGGGEGKPELLQRPILKVGQISDPCPFFGMFFGAGAITQGIEVVHQRLNPKGVRGELMPGLVLTRMVLDIAFRRNRFVPPTPIGIGLDDGPIEDDDRLLVLASTLERLFLGLHPYWGREVAPLHFTAVAPSPRYLFRTLPSVLRGRRSSFATPENGYRSHNVHSLRLALTGKYTLDGELFPVAATSDDPLIVTDGGRAGFIRL